MTLGEELQELMRDLPEVSTTAAAKLTADKWDADGRDERRRQEYLDLGWAAMGIERLRRDKAAGRA